MVSTDGTLLRNLVAAGIPCLGFLTLTPRAVVEYLIDVPMRGMLREGHAGKIRSLATVDLARRFQAGSGQRHLALGTCAEPDVTMPGVRGESCPVASASQYIQAEAGLHRALMDICGDGLIRLRLFHLDGPGEDSCRLIPYLIPYLFSGQTVELRAAGLLRDYASGAHVAR